MQKIFLCILLIGFRPVYGQSGIKGVDSPFHLYLLAGQSNMAGRGAVDSESKQVNPRILMLNRNNEWVVATDPVHFDKPGVAGVGPAIAFAEEMLREDTNIRIGLIPCAWGGSSIKVWQPDSAYLTGHPYDDAVTRTRIVMRSGILKGILWHQGESDNNTQGAADYAANLQRLIGRFRQTFVLPELPFVAGEIGHFRDAPVNNSINSLPSIVPYTAVVSAAGLRDKGDRTHFDTPSARELGRRYARAMKLLLHPKK